VIARVLEANIYYIINVLSQIYYYMIIGYILLSWFPNARESFIGELLSKLVEPYLRPFRRFIPSIGFIDLSPIVALISLYFVKLGVFTIISYIFKAF
jgi:YggT family protein